MTQQQLEKRQERATTETLVISRTEEGFRVYSPAYPTKSYIVSGSPEAPVCSCPDFEHHQGDGEWRCKHILAVLEHVAKPDSCVPQTESHRDEERGAIQEEAGAKPKRKRLVPAANGIPQMLIKRSVSPDGRIDSLSVEFSCPVEKIPVGEIRSKAEGILDLQSDVIESFLSRNGRGAKEEAPASPQNGAVPAKMLSIGGMDGKWGRRLFINVQANGQTLKLFGNRKQLGEALTTAGYPYLADHVNEGASFNLPCRIITKPSGDGRYTNIEKVLPVPMPQAQPQRGWRQ